MSSNELIELKENNNKKKVHCDPYEPKNMNNNLLDRNNERQMTSNLVGEGNLEPLQRKIRGKK
jgi:hypothetical protein